MKTQFSNGQKYLLKIGYGDDCWDLGEDCFWSNDLNELFKELQTNLTIEEIAKMLEENAYAEDENTMWYIVDTTRIELAKQNSTWYLTF